MKKPGLKNRISQLLRINRRRSLDQNDLCPLKPLDNRCNEPADTEAKVSSQKLIVNLSRESGRLRWDLAHKNHVAKEVIIPFLPLIKLHCDGLTAAVQQCDMKIKQCNAAWEVTNSQHRDSISTTVQKKIELRL